MIKSVSKIALSTLLVCSSIVVLPEMNKANAVSAQGDTVKISPSIERTFNSDSMDYFTVKSTKNQTVKLSIKNAKKKRFGVIVFKAKSAKVEAFVKENIDRIDQMNEKEMDKLFDMIFNDFKVITSIDNEIKEYSGGKRTDEIRLGKGNYHFLTVTDSNIKKYGKGFTLSLTNTKNTAIESEFNDTIATANAMRKSTTYKGHFDILTDDHDYFKVSVPKTGKLVLDTKVAGKAAMNFNIYSKDKKKIARSVKKTGNSYRTVANVKKGTYYVRIGGSANDIDQSFLDYNARVHVKTKTPSAKVTNKKGAKSDLLTISNIVKGDQVCVYSDSKKTKLITSFKAKSTSAKIKTKNLKDQGGKLYVTSKSEGLYTSFTQLLTYKKAQ